MRSRIAKELWAKEFFLGISVIDQLIFSAFAHTDDKNPIQYALELVRDSEVLRPGFVVYPLHSFGVIAAGLLHAYSSARVQFQVPGYGLIVSPQTNSYTSTLSFLETAASELKIKKKIPQDLVEHWIRSRPTRWLEKNPLLVLRIHSFPGGYYENQFFLIHKLKMATTLLLMLNAFQAFESGEPDEFFNTSRTNNWETLDIHHYILFFPKPNSRKLSGDCIPMNSNAATLADLSSVPVNIDPRFWRRRIHRSEELVFSLNQISKNYLRYSIGQSKNNVKSKVFRKMYRALEFYRKSHRVTDDIGESALYLAIAFEILLTDNFAQGVVSENIFNRVSTLLKGLKGNRKLKASVRELYWVRNKYVHSGEVNDTLCLNTARAAFIYSFLALSPKLNSLTYKNDEPIKRLVNL